MSLPSVMLASSELDRRYLENWIQELGLETAWQKVTH